MRLTAHGGTAWKCALPRISNHALAALAGFALSIALPAHASERARHGAPKSKAPTQHQRRAAESALLPSEASARVADWIAATGDNGSLPYAIVDKTNAAVFLFDATGQPLGAAPVLIGIAPGDDATPGIGSKKLAEIGPAEKTTPAGRFLAKYGLAFGHENMLWVDYATSVGMHPIPKDAGSREHRRDRMLSPTPDDNRITFGCINVPKAFYKLVRPLFAKEGGYVYVLPDTRPIEDVFPQLRVQALINARAAEQAAADPGSFQGVSPRDPAQ